MEMTPGARRFVSVTFVAFGVFVAAGLSSVSVGDWPFAAGAPISAVGNACGPLGSLLAWVGRRLFGEVFAWLVPTAAVAIGLATLADRVERVSRWVGRALILCVLFSALVALSPYSGRATGLTGRAGDTVAAGLALIVGRIGSAIVVLAIVLVLTLGELTRASRLAGRLSFPGVRWLVVGRRALGAGPGRVARAIVDRFGRWRGDDGSPEARESGFPPAISRRRESGDDVAGSDVASNKSPGVRPAPIEIRTPAKRRALPAARAASTPRSPSTSGRGVPLEKAMLPRSDLLERSPDTEPTYSREKLKTWSAVLEEKLGNYGVEGRVSSVHHGPVVTTFEFEPATGVRIKDIVSRSDDLALAMRARSLRMIAPIPGRAAVGIEIPNPESRIVYLRDVIESVAERDRLRGVVLAIGVDVVGEPFLMNICEAPHLLIAGTTGSGKSVCLNAILASILLQYRPSDVRLILVDPKMVEMSGYNGIPHLLHPVITDPKEAARVLEFLVGEMSRRNNLFRENNVRNVESYNAKIAMEKTMPGQEKSERLPYIVVVIDELGDLALAKGADIETLLARLAQMARAAGIHMVLATQRPSVDVIVGKTKANFPTRIAFRVATRVDSRTILDTIGADKLLGKGDMLYTDARNPQPLRLHGAWVSDADMERLIGHWQSYQFEESTLDLHGPLAGSASVAGDLDPLFDDAKGVVVRFKQGSTSLLQRKLHVGYARAARLLDQLEQNGIVGPPDGSKPRQVYLETLDETMLD